MSDTVIAAEVPEVDMGSGKSEGQPATIHMPGGWGDFNKDMAAIAKEQGVDEKDLGPLVVEPVQPEPNQPPQAVVTQPVETKPATQPQESVVKPEVPAIPVVEVPEKFRGPDGKLDQEKLMKSYLEAEKTLKRAQNAKSQPVAQQVQEQPNVVPGANAGPLTPFEVQVAQDIFNGGGFTEQQAISMARVQVKLAEARHKAEVASTFGRVAQLEEQLTVQQQRTELESLAKTNPEVLTPKGYAELVKIREEHPWINASPEPWKAATLVLLGQRGMAGTVNIPNPTGVQQTAQPLPVTPSQPIQNPTVKLNTPQEVDAYVKTLTPEQEGEFWKRQGLKWEAPRTQFKGI